MLVITRHESEEVVIGDPRNPFGTVRVASIRGDRVRLAFTFGKHIDVHRREVADEILSQHKESGALAAAESLPSMRLAR